jgi:AraC-like DNA-binding protein
VNQRVSKGDGSWRALSWTWSPTEWGWLPTLDSYRPGLGGPSRTVCLRMDTRHAPAPERLELWRQVTGVALGLDYERTDQTPAKGFHGSGAGFFTDHGNQLVLSNSDALGIVRTHRQAKESPGALAFGFMLEGERHAVYDGDVRIRTQAGDFFVDDARRRFHMVYPQKQRSIFVNIPRAQVAAVFGDNIPTPSELTAALRASRLAPVIRSQLAAIAQHSAKFNDTEGEAAMVAAANLVLAALAATREDRALGVEDAPAIIISARRHIDMHLGDPELDVDDVARAVGCSRRTLYRVFAEAGAGVAETIRDLRLEQMRVLLESEPLTVADAAERCGFSDPRTLQRQFKARFGLSARDVQVRARAI